LSFCAPGLRGRRWNRTARWTRSHSQTRRFGIHRPHPRRPSGDDSRVWYL